MFQYQNNIVKYYVNLSNEKHIVKWTRSER